MKRSRIKPMSAKRRSNLKLRTGCREIVLARDRTCRGFTTTPVPCAQSSSEVHELGRGAYRESCWLNPDLCIGLCHRCHAWVTEHPIEAQEAGLAWPGWKVQQFLDDAAACH